MKKSLKDCIQKTVVNDFRCEWSPIVGGASIGPALQLHYATYLLMRQKIGLIVLFLILQMTPRYVLSAVAGRCS